MKYNKFIYGFFAGLIFESLLVAIRYENKLMVKETVLFLESGQNPFWMFFIANIGILLLCIFFFLLYKEFVKSTDSEEVKANE
jgi:uncharacterized membrane protein